MKAASASSDSCSVTFPDFSIESDTRDLHLGGFGEICCTTLTLNLHSFVIRLKDYYRAMYSNYVSLISNLFDLPSSFIKGHEKNLVSWKRAE